MRPAPTALDLMRWEDWVLHTSTEVGQIGKVIRRRHAEQHQHTRCDFPFCDIHPRPLTELQLTNDKEDL